MDSYTRNFTLEETRSSQGAIVATTGRTGYWPFRRVISYHIGVNCDVISIRDGRLQVLRRGRTIAIAELLGTPAPLARLLRTGWEALLHPRHARASAAERSQDLKWEDMLRSRRK